MGCSETRTNESRYAESLYAKRVNRCQQLNVEVAAKQFLAKAEKERKTGIKEPQPQFDEEKCRPPGSGLDHRNSSRFPVW